MAAKTRPVSSRPLAALPLHGGLNEHTEAAQPAAEEHAHGSAQKCRHPARLDVLPGNQMVKEIGRKPAGSKPERASHDHADQGCDRDSREDCFPGHSLSHRGPLGTGKSVETGALPMLLAWG